MLARFIGRFGRTLDDKPLCPHCDGDLLQQAKQQLVDGHHIGAIASARCCVSRRLRQTCISLQLFKKSRQSKHPNMAGMIGRLLEAGAIDGTTRKYVQDFGRSTAAMLDGGPHCGGGRAWKAISQAANICRELDRQLTNFRQDELLAANSDDGQPDQSANL